jgi:hypothetical protein
MGRFRHSVGSRRTVISAFAGRKAVDHPDGVSVHRRERIWARCQEEQFDAEGRLIDEKTHACDVTRREIEDGDHDRRSQRP